MTRWELQQRFRYNRFFAQAFLNASDAGNDTSSSTKGTYLLRSGQPRLATATCVSTTTSCWSPRQHA